MTQEDYNDMRRTPEEGYWIRKLKPEPCKIYCPQCGFAYLGDGIKPCVDCQSKEKIIKEML